MKLFKTKPTRDEGLLEFMVNCLLPVTGDIFKANTLNLPENSWPTWEKYLSFTINASRYIPLVAGITYSLIK